MPVVFRNQIAFFHVGSDGLFGFTAGVGAVVGEIVVGVNVFEQAAFFVAAHAAGLPRGVEFMGGGIRAAVKRVVVGRFVDAHAQKNHRGMIAVLHHHFARVLHGDVLPSVAADVLPAGNFGEDQQSQLVTAVDEVARLRVMRGAHRVKTQFFL